MPLNYNIEIDYKNCRNDDDKLFVFDRAVKKFNRKLHKYGVIQEYIDRMYFQNKKQRKKLKDKRNKNFYLEKNS